MREIIKKWGFMFWTAIMIFLLSGCGKPYLSALNPSGEVAKMQKSMMLLSTIIMIGVLLVVLIIYLIVIIRFRRKDDRIPKQVEGSSKLEFIWTTIPAILVIILSVYTVILTFKMADVSAMDKAEKGKSDELVVNVRANLYWWEFEYPNEGIVTSQELVVPTDEKIYFNLKASDVKHSFWIPSIGGKMDTNTDNLNKFWLEFDEKKATEAGRMFYGKCAELCGPSHALMDFKVKAVPRSEFDQWIASMKNMKEPKKAESSLASKGQEIFKNNCLTCHKVTPDNSTAAAARIAPNLTNFSDREFVAGVLENNEENIKKWLKDPESIKPGNKMAGTYGSLTDEEIEALTAYLLQLKVDK